MAHSPRNATSTFPTSASVELQVGDRFVCEDAHVRDLERRGLLGRAHLLGRNELRKAGHERRDDVPLETHVAIPDAADRGDRIGILRAQDTVRLPQRGAGSRGTSCRDDHARRGALAR